ncbi:MAG: hypothetical protein LBN27_07865 [Prevotellaceae bacterium]|jgi:hypothetical protein|nr:hypothetical protein [Prevotellaceae bacterium]
MNYIPIIPNEGGFNFALPAGEANLPQPIGEIPMRGTSDRWARADHVHNNKHFRHFHQDEPQAMDYSIAKWGEEDGQETMKFYGWGFSSGKQDLEDEFRYAWKSHYKHRFAQYNSGTTVLYYVPNPTNYDGSHSGDTPVLLANPQMTQLRTHNAGYGHRPIIDGGRDLGNAKEFTAVYSTRATVQNPQAQGEYVNYGARWGEDYFKIYQDGNKPLFSKDGSSSDIVMFGAYGGFSTDNYGGILPQSYSTVAKFSSGGGTFYYNGNSVGMGDNSGQNWFGTYGSTTLGNANANTEIRGNYISLTGVVSQMTVNNMTVNSTLNANNMNILGIDGYAGTNVFAGYSGSGSGTSGYLPGTDSNGNWAILNFKGDNNLNCSLMFNSQSGNLWFRYKAPGSSSYSFKQISTI